MSVLNETTLENIVVKVSTPPPPVDIPEAVREIVDPIRYSDFGTFPIGKDKPADLMAKIRKKENLRDTLIKTYKNTKKSEKEREAEKPVGEEADSEKNNYEVDDLTGVIEPGVENDPLPTQVAIFNNTVRERFDNFPSAVYVPAIFSMLSMPYIPTESKRHRNGVLNNGKTIDLLTTPYLWNSLEELRDPNTGALLNVLQPRPDGSVHMTPPSRGKDRLPITLTPYVQESFAGRGIKNGKELNSFCLLLGLEPGCSDSRNQPIPWEVVIRFGEIEVKITEGRAELDVKAGSNEPLKVAITPSASQVTTHHFGAHP